MARPYLRRHGAALVASIAGLLATVNAYRPLARKGRLSMAAVGFGVVVSELPLQTIAGQFAGLTLVSPRLQRGLRRTAWLMSLVSWLGLLGLHRIGRRVDIELSKALDAELGPSQPPTRDAIAAKNPGLLRTMRIYRDYAHDPEISYGEHGAANLLDIWRGPELDSTSRAPVLLQIHGGAWTTGDKRGQAHPLMSHLADRGWICVSINYRLSPRHTWPDHIVDVKRAIVWVKDNIGRYGGDPEFIAITGGSAGGHLAALAALTPDVPEFQPGFTEADTRVQAAVPCYGVYDFTRTDDGLHPMMAPYLEKTIMKRLRTQHLTIFEQASPITHVSPSAPPFFVLHGRSDSFIPVEQARHFVARLRDASPQPVVYAELPFAQHAFDILGSARATHAAVAVERFLDQVYRDRRPG